MADNDEYNSLISQKNDAVDEKNQRQRIIDEINEKLERLYPVKNVLSNQKSAFKSAKKQIAKCFDDDYAWTGSTYDEFIGKGNELKEQNESFFKFQLDRLLDEINNEITRLENERSNQYGIIGHLVSLINSLSNSIENFFN